MTAYILRRLFGRYMREFCAANPHICDGARALVSIGICCDEYAAEHDARTSLG